MWDTWKDEFKWGHIFFTTQSMKETLRTIMSLLVEQLCHNNTHGRRGGNNNQYQYDIIWFSKVAFSKEAVALEPLYVYIPVQEVLWFPAVGLLI